MKWHHYAVALAPVVVAVCSEIQDKVPPRYAIFVVAAMAAAMYFVRSPMQGKP